MLMSSRRGFSLLLRTMGNKRRPSTLLTASQSLVLPPFRTRQSFRGFCTSSHLLNKVMPPPNKEETTTKEQRMSVDGDMLFRARLPAASDSEATVFRAMVGNGIITVLKFGAYGMTGSSAMFGEAIHSLCDMGNQGILIKGLQEMKLAPDRRHNYGYGRAAFFWGLVSALGMFWLGCGFTIYHGVDMIMHPPESLDISWHVWTVLGLSFGIDGYVLYKVISNMAQQKPADQSWRMFLSNIKDPFTMAVLFEDSAACLGVLIAGGGLAMAEYTGNVMWDGVASLAIGGILGVTAYYLARINQRFLIGQAIEPDMEAGIKNLLLQRDCIEHVYAVRSQWIGPSHFSFKAEVDFDGTFLAARLYNRYEKHFLNAKDLKADLPLILSWFAEDVTRIVEKEVRDVETTIRAKYPEAAYIELEPDSARTFEHAVEGMSEKRLRALEKEAIKKAIAKVARIVDKKRSASTTSNGNNE